MCPHDISQIFWPGSVNSPFPNLCWGKEDWKTVHWEIIWEWVHVTALSVTCHAANSRATAFQHSPMSLPALLLMELGWVETRENLTRAFYFCKRLGLCSHSMFASSPGLNALVSPWPLLPWLCAGTQGLHPAVLWRWKWEHLCSHLVHRDTQQLQPPAGQRCQWQQGNQKGKCWPATCEVLGLPEIAAHALDPWPLVISG